MRQSLFVEFFKRIRGDYSLWSELFEQNKQITRQLEQVEENFDIANRIDAKRALEFLNGVQVIQQNINFLKESVSSLKQTQEELVCSLKQTQKELVSHFDNVELFRYKNSQKQALIAQMKGADLIGSRELPLNKNRFLLFHYFYHSPMFGDYLNLGDYVQTIATRNLLNEFKPNSEFCYWDRDCLNFFKPTQNESVICVMQGWFAHSFNFLPNDYIRPVWVHSF